VLVKLPEHNTGRNCVLLKVQKASKCVFVPQEMHRLARPKGVANKASVKSSTRRIYCVGCNTQHGGLRKIRRANLQTNKRNIKIRCKSLRSVHSLPVNVQVHSTALGGVSANSDHFWPWYRDFIYTHTHIYIHTHVCSTYVTVLLRSP